MLVVPRDLSPRRRYSLATIALAFAGFGAGGASGRLRALLSPLSTFDEGWPALRRWLRAVDRESRIAVVERFGAQAQTQRAPQRMKVSYSSRDSLCVSATIAPKLAIAAAITNPSP